jgi:hypothetical protein
MSGVAILRGDVSVGLLRPEADDAGASLAVGALVDTDCEVDSLPSPSIGDATSLDARYVCPYGVGESHSPGDGGVELFVSPPYSTSGPGSVYTGFSASAVVHVLMPARFAFHIYGRISRLLYVGRRRGRLYEPGTIDTAAQFM